MCLFNDLRKIRKATEASRDELCFLKLAVESMRLEMQAQTELLSQLVTLLTPPPEPPEPPVVGLGVEPNPPTDRP